MRTCIALLAPSTAGAALTWLAPIPRLLTAVGADAQLGGDPDAAVVHLAALVAWVLIGWLVLATVTALIAQLPGVVGRTGAAVSRRVTPTLIRRAIGGTAALGIVVSPALVPSAARAAGCASSQLPILDRTSSPCSLAPAAASVPSRPIVAAPTSASGDARDAPVAPAAPVAPVAPVAPRTYTVVAGDTLWGLAAAQVAAAGRPVTPARVAERWPSWWQANRVVIGEDPDLIHVGTDLLVPDPLEMNR